MAPKQSGVKKAAMMIWNQAEGKYEAWDGVLNTGDIEIGAVEIKDADTDNRANVIATNGQKGLVTLSPGHVSTDNSTATPLADGATFTGTWEEITNFGIIVVSVYADQVSAADGLEVEFSSDGTNVDGSDCYTIPASTGKTFSFQAATKYFRVKYTNGGVTQTAFRLQTILKPYYVKPSSHRINDAIIGEDDAELVKAVLTGENPGGAFINFQSTTAGNFKMSLEELENVISSNSNTQLNVTPFHADGTEGALISGVDYVAGKSGIDAATEVLETIEYEHHEIHSGSHFNYCEYALNQGSGATIELVITTPNTTEWAHVTFDFSASEGATIELYEGTSGITGGTPITPRNNNRNSAHASTLTILKDPSAITTDGTRAAGFLAGGGRTAGFASRDKENILKQNETYLIRITSLAVSNDISWCGEWYEHTNRN